jgi:hypothetical protein
MRVPYAVQGFLFAPAFIGLVFFLQVTCPEPSGGGCFADLFTLPMFMPVVFIHYVWGGLAILTQYELMFVVLYWSLVGALFGLCFDIYKEDERGSQNPSL